MKIISSPGVALVASALLFAESPATAATAGSPHAADWTEARMRAESGGKDIAVLLYGSDWSRAGRGIKNDIWDSPGFAAAVGPEVVLLAIEHNEKQPGESENQELRYWATSRSLDERSPATMSITKAQDDAGNPLKPMPDGSVLATGAAPDKAIYTLEMRMPAATSPALAIVFLPDESFPGNKAGRASNGNCVINGIEVQVMREGVAKPVKIEAAWADFVGSANEGVDRAINGDHDPANYWNMCADKRQGAIQMLLLPAEPLPPAALLSIKIHSVSKHRAHVPGRMRVEHVGDANIAALLRSWKETTRRLADLTDRNAGHPCATGNSPAVFLLDAGGRLVAQRHGLSLADTSDGIAAWVAEGRDLRRERDALWERAKTLTGIDKAHALARGLEMLNMGLGPQSVYQPVLDAIREADPEDRSHRIRQFTLNVGEIGKQAAQLVEKSGEEAAIAYLNSELDHPGNTYLNTNQLQSLHWTAYGFYRGKQGHEAEVINTFLQIARIDPGNSLGYACASKYLMQADNPSLRFGWNAKHTSAMPATWELGGEIEPLTQYFPRPGGYEITLRSDGKAEIAVDKVELRKGDKIVATAADGLPLALSKDQPNGTLRLVVSQPGEVKDAVLRIAVRGDKPGTGTFAVHPVSAPPPADELSGETTRHLVQLEASLRQSLLRRTSGGRENIRAIAADESYQKELMHHEILRLTGAANLAPLIETRSGAEFLKRFLDDTEWMWLWLPGAHSKEPAAELLRLKEIWRHDPAVGHDPVLKRIATTVALALDSIDKYNYFKESHELGRLHETFYQLTPQLMRGALGVDPDSGRYLRDQVNRPFHAYGNIHYLAPYRLNNIFGDSIHGRDFHRPWTGLPRMQQIHWGAGVCGSLTTLGENVFKSHGIPSHGMGEPGHRAYKVRRPDGRWMKLYSLTNATNTLAEDAKERIWSDTAAIRRASPHLWQARLLAAGNADGKADPAEVDAAYQLARAAHPIWDEVWLEHIAALKGRPPAAKINWIDFTRELVPAMAPQGEATTYGIWAGYQAEAVKGLDPEQMIAVHLAMQDAFLAQYPDNFASFHGMLTAQTAHFGKDEKAIGRFLQKVLHNHAKNPSRKNALMLWGTELAAAFPARLTTITDLLVKNLALDQEQTDDRLKNDALTRLLAVARDKKQFADYHHLANLCDALLPLDQPKERHLNDKQLQNHPAWVTFGGSLLSRYGILRSHNANNGDRIVMHPRVLDERGGFVWAAPHKNAWVEVELPRPARLSGIVVVNRYEDHKFAESQTPLKISVSVDGRKWEEVFNSDQPEAVWRVDLARTQISARFVRVGTLREKPTHFQLRNILIYGVWED